jgi:hypothetical protein
VQQGPGSAGIDRFGVLFFGFAQKNKKTVNHLKVYELVKSRIFRFVKVSGRDCGGG